jgi:type II secretory pathway pseudopilin PulG
MPSITPSYLYTLVALIVVSSLLVLAFMAYADTLRYSSELRQLSSLVHRIASKITELQTLAIPDNSVSEIFVQMPTSIGNQQYWLQLQNDSARAWLEGGLGNVPIDETDLRVYLSSDSLATGYFIGGYGAAHLTCQKNVGVTRVLLESSR